MGNLVAVGCLDEGIDTVVDVLLDGVVHRAFRRWRARTVVVHAKSASAVYEVNIVAHLVELHIELRSLPEGGLYAAYLGYLRANVEVYEAEAVAHVLLV